jgi:hypothetical protein
VLGAATIPRRSMSRRSAQVKAGNMVMSAGPYVEDLGTGAGPRRPAWASSFRHPTAACGSASACGAPPDPVEEVRVIANGFQVAAFDPTTKPRVRPAPKSFQRAGGTARFRATVAFDVTQDTYFVVEAGAKLPTDPDALPAPPEVMNVVVPGVVPVAITNPIFVDTNGNGVFDPPGLPVMAASGGPTERPPFARVDLVGDGVWERARSALGRIAARLGGTAVAEPVGGEMTGVTKERKAEAARKGEYFPIYQFSIPLEAAEEARRAAERAAREAAGGEAPRHEVPAR